MNKNRKRIFLFAFVLIFLGGLFLLFNEQKRISFSLENNENLSLEKDKETKKVSPFGRLFQPIKEEESGADNNSNFYQNLFSSDKKKPEDFGNYTEYLAYLVFQKFKNSTNPEEVISQEEVMNELKKRMPSLENEFSLERKFFKLEDLKIVLKKSSSTVEKFNQDFLKIAKETGLDKNTPSRAFQKLAENMDTSYLQKTIESTDEFLKKATTIDVPLGYQEIYLEYLNTLSLANEIYRAVVDYQNDPLKAIIALNSLDKVSKKIKAIALLFEDKLKEDGFSSD